MHGYLKILQRHKQNPFSQTENEKKPPPFLEVGNAIIIGGEVGLNYFMAKKKQLDR